MNLSFIFPVILFAFTIQITPGPNNIMLTASGANFGYKRSVPHILGIVSGIAILNVFSAFGLKQLFNLFPFLNTILKVVGSGYLIYLAIKIALSKKESNGDEQSKPIGFFQGALFQVLNPKVFLLTITAMSCYTLENESYYKSALIVLILVFVIGLLSFSTWATLGTIIGKFLNYGNRRKIFNYSMGVVTACSVYFIIF